MINKKFAGVLALSLATVALAACGGTKTSSSAADSKTTSTPASVTTSVAAPEVPVAEGKYSIYFTLGDDSVVKTLSSYNSFFLTGTFCNWAEKANAVDTTKPTEVAAEFQNLAGTKVYYVQIDKTQFQTSGELDKTKRGYQLTIGWNNTCGATSQAGIDWNYKADYNKLYTGTQCPRLDYPTSGDLIELYGATAITADPNAATDGQRAGHEDDEKSIADPATVVHYQTFSEQKPAVVEVKGLKYKFKINDKDKAGTAKPSWVTGLYACGSYDKWNGAFDDEHKLTADTDGYYTITFGDSYAGVKIEFMVVAQTVNAAGTKSTGFWDYKLQGTNLAYTPADGDATNPTVTRVAAYSFEAWPGDPDQKYDVAISVTLTDWASKKDSVVGLGIKGAWESAWPMHKMTAGATAGSFTFTIFQIPAGTYEFGFATIDSADAQVDWINDGKNNLKFVCSATALTFAFTGTIAGGCSAVTA